MQSSVNRTNYGLARDGQQHELARDPSTLSQSPMQGFKQ